MSTELEQDDNEQEQEQVLPKDQLKAKALRQGSRVAIVAPSSRPASPLELRRCVQIVEEMGFLAVVGKHAMANDGFSAGSDELRLDDLQTFVEDDSIEAVLCASGGYGALRLLPLLDFGQIRRHPKIFLGSGANDALLLAINELTGLVVFHGSNLDDVGDKHTFNAMKDTLMGTHVERAINCRDQDEAPYEAASYSLADRICQGIICGGNMTALSSLYGTRYQPEFTGKILVLDDFSERNSILDRWFTTFYLAGTLEQVEGIAFGGFPGCGTRGADNMLSIEDTFGDRIKELDIAACFGFKFGLSSKDNIVPIGIQAKLDCSAGTLTLLEPALN